MFKHLDRVNFLNVTCLPDGESLKSSWTVVIRDEWRVSGAVRVAAAGEGRHKERNAAPGPPAEAWNQS